MVSPRALILSEGGLQDEKMVTEMDRRERKCSRGFVKGLRSAYKDLQISDRAINIP